MNLRNVNLEDFSVLFAWRNDELTRQNSHNTAPVTLSNHIAWLRDSLVNPSRHLFIAEHNGVPVGTCRADKQENGYLLSWTIAPEHRNKGYGKQMVALLTKRLDPPFYAEVKRENFASITIAKSVGMFVYSESTDYLYFLKSAVSQESEERQGADVGTG